VLHYIENSRTKVANDMVLMDLGLNIMAILLTSHELFRPMEHFRQSKKLIYDLVYQAQEAGIAA
jgi:Xaa-Pro aminopeptidase